MPRAEGWPRSIATGETPWEAELPGTGAQAELGYQGNRQISRELDLNTGDVQQMTHQLRRGIVVRRPEVKLRKEVECDEAYVVAGHKGHPEAVKKTA